MPLKRDPVSELFDNRARELLVRVYRLPRGAWAGVRVPPPSRNQVRWAAGMGIDLRGPDNASTEGSHYDARTRWLRAFVRSLNYQHKWYSDGRGGSLRTEKRTTPVRAPLEVEVGGWLAPVMRDGRITVPGGNAVRARIRYGGKTARRVVEAMPDSKRIWTDDGRPAGLFSNPVLRDW